MDSPETKQDFQRFPALSLCAVVDSKFHSRKLIVKDLQSGGLFLKVREAESLEHGLELLQTERTDACVFGPYISPKATAMFLKSVDSTATQETAFLSILNYLADERDYRKQCAVHGVLKWPYTQKVFREQIINSVVQANSNSPWIPLLRKQVVSTKRRQAQHIYEEESSTSWSLFDGLLPSLKNIAHAFERGEYDIQVNGSPTEPAKVAIKQLANGITSTVTLSATALSHFTDFIEWSITYWFFEMALESEEYATAQLKRRLEDYIQQFNSSHSL